MAASSSSVYAPGWTITANPQPVDPPSPAPERSSPIAAPTPRAEGWDLPAPPGLDASSKAWEEGFKMAASSRSRFGSESNADAGFATRLPVTPPPVRPPRISQIPACVASNSNAIALTGPNRWNANLDVNKLTIGPVIPADCAPAESMAAGSSSTTFTQLLNLRSDMPTSSTATSRTSNIGGGRSVPETKRIEGDPAVRTGDGGRGRAKPAFLKRRGRPHFSSIFGGGLDASPASTSDWIYRPTQASQTHPAGDDSPLGEPGTLKPQDGGLPNRPEPLSDCDKSSAIHTDSEADLSAPVATPDGHIGGPSHSNLDLDDPVVKSSNEVEATSTGPVGTTLLLETNGSKDGQSGQTAIDPQQSSCSSSSSSKQSSAVTSFTVVPDSERADETAGKPKQDTAKTGQETAKTKQDTAKTEQDTAKTEQDKRRPAFLEPARYEPFKNGDEGSKYGPDVRFSEEAKFFFARMMVFDRPTGGPEIENACRETSWHSLQMNRIAADNAMSWMVVQREQSVLHIRGLFEAVHPDFSGRSGIFRGLMAFQRGWTIICEYE